MASSELMNGPAVEPVTAAEAMQQLRIDDEANAPLVERALISAREDVEFDLGRALISQTRLISLTAWPSCPRFGTSLLMDRPPIQSISEVRYWDGVQWQLLPDSLYSLERLDRIHHMLVPTQAWPALGQRPGARVRVTYVAGFGAVGSAVPEVIRSWIVAQAGIRFFDPLGEKPIGDHIHRPLDQWRTRI